MPTTGTMSTDGGSIRSKIAVLPTVGKIKIVVKRPRKHKPKHDKPPWKGKPGLPNRTKEWTEAPQVDDDEFEADEFFSPVEDAIPCDTFLAFQALTQPSSTSPTGSLTIPLLASLEPIAGILESQLVPALQQNDQDQDSFAMVARELPELMRKNALRRLTSIATPGGGADRDLTVLVSTGDYIRGVWDSHDGTDAADDTPEQRELHRSYVQWFVSHLHCWTGRLLTESQLQRTWTRDPPSHNLPYAMITSLPKALEYFQKIQIVMAHHRHQREATHQLWLPQWGSVLSSVQTAQTKMIRKLQQTYQKEVSEKTFLQQPFYQGVSTRLLLQLMQDQGKVMLVPKPVGNFVKLMDKNPKTKTKR